jgi:hypothetical protein
MEIYNYCLIEYKTMMKIKLIHIEYNNILNKIIEH